MMGGMESTRTSRTISWLALSGSLVAWAGLLLHTSQGVRDGPPPIGPVYKWLVGISGFWLLFSAVAFLKYRETAARVASWFLILMFLLISCDMAMRWARYGAFD